MAHSCPECGQACYCDLEDTWWDDPDDCVHECGPEIEDDEAVEMEEGD